jgi:hypothetical protein
MDTKVLLVRQVLFFGQKIFGLDPRYCLAALPRQLGDVGGDAPSARWRRGTMKQTLSLWQPCRAVSSLGTLSKK